MAAGDRPAVLVDRDGTVIPDLGYPREPERVTLLPGAADALRSFAEAGLPIVVVSNQSGIGRGLITQAEAAAVHERFVELLAGEGVELAGAYYCPHAPHVGCDCRKPQPGLLLRAADDLGLDLGRSVMVGDRDADVEAGRRAGARTVRFPSGGAWSEVAATVLDLTRAAA
jgi:D-glycero-D-manno-heptose 1,7-bisphosphate phosphatase